MSAFSFSIGSIATWIVVRWCLRDDQSPLSIAAIVRHVTQSTSLRVTLQRPLLSWNLLQSAHHHFQIWMKHWRQILLKFISFDVDIAVISFPSAVPQKGVRSRIQLLRQHFPLLACFWMIQWCCLYHQLQERNFHVRYLVFNWQFTSKCCSSVAVSILPTLHELIFLTGNFRSSNTAWLKCRTCLASSR